MQTNKHNAELLATQLKQEEQNDTKENSGNKNTQTVERIPIEYTPFIAIRWDNKCFGTFGKYRITDYKETMPEVIDELSMFSYDIVLKLISIIIAEEVKSGIAAHIEELKQSRQGQMRNIQINDDLGKTQVAFEKMEEGT